MHYSVSHYSINDLQRRLLGDIEMKRMFKCLGLFVGWLQGGLYDFNSLPVSVFKHLNHEDMDAIMKIYSKYSCKLSLYKCIVIVLLVCVSCLP